MTMFLIISFCLLTAGYIETANNTGLWFESASNIRVHDAFYPHPHLKDLKLAAKRGKILAVTLVVSAGLVFLVSTAVVRSGKDKEKINTTDNISPSELRGYVIAATAAGRQVLEEGAENAIKISLETYSSKRGINWEAGTISYTPNATYSIGRDQVTVFIAENSRGLEIQAICGKIGASARASIDNDSIQSSIFTL